MKHLTGTFIISAEKLSQCPDLKLPEFPLLGRSNVGKSSFINTIANNKKLAKTSNTPGKTRLINFFNFSEKFVITDLPGYGYAKVSQEIRKKWEKNLEEYLLNRYQIKILIQIVDSRHELQKNDIQMREWVNAYNLHAATVVTKTDCISKSEINGVLSKVKKQFGGEVFPFSTVNQQYNEQILDFFIDISRRV